MKAICLLYQNILDFQLFPLLFSDKTFLPSVPEIRISVLSPRRPQQTIFIPKKHCCSK
jgi:hypothetical protein